MATRERAVRRALRTAYREQVRAATHYAGVARTVRNAQLHSVLLRFAAEEESGVAQVQGLMAARNVSPPALVFLTQLRAGLAAFTTHLRSWRSALEDSLHWAEIRAERLGRAIEDAGGAGDLDAARSLEELWRHTAEQSEWISTYLS